MINFFRPKNPIYIRIYYYFVTGLSAPLADDNEITAPYGGCEYTVTAGTDVAYFWGCGIPGENKGLTTDATSTTRYTTDTGCGNQLVSLLHVRLIYVVDIGCYINVVS